MRRIKIVWWFVFIGVTLTYWVSINAVDQTLTLWALRKSLLYYTGIMATAMMSLGVILAMRVHAVENLIGGLDQHYRLHKWVGMSTALFALAHWLIKLGPKWLVKHDFAQAISFKTPADITGFFAENNLLTPMRSLAKDSGEWAIYALLGLVILALWKRFPYRAFFKTHKLMAIVYLVLVFHSVVLFGEVGWVSPVGIFMGIVMAIGSMGAVISLLGKVGAHQRVLGIVKSVTSHTADRVLEVHIDLGTHWSGHEEGQFAFVTFDPKEGAHPFSISSPWRQDGELVFHIKALGDYTAQLPAHINVGQAVTVEGPYGRFQFEPLASNNQQVWVAGGIGITPFLSRLQMLAEGVGDDLSSDSPQAPITLYYCTRVHDSSFVSDLLRLCNQAGVTLKIIASGRDKPLTGEVIRHDISNWSSAHYWFCGPAILGQSVRDDLVAHGLKSSDFHQELFEMR